MTAFVGPTSGLICKKEGLFVETHYLPPKIRSYLFPFFVK
jgi:hypothetical protein